jgi:hypothetical protein
LCGKPGSAPKGTNSPRSELIRKIKAHYRSGKSSVAADF